MNSTKSVSELSDDEIKSEVRKTYAGVAQATSSNCCNPSAAIQPNTLALALGYDVADLPDSATESFAGCGNPVALASLREGETVLDLGSGAGLDMFVAAKRVGESGRVIGVDMTPEMIQKAEKNAKDLGISNVEVRQGDIEELPVENESVDVVISNCVINLAPNKDKVFREAFRVLRPGGRVLISDIVIEEVLPEKVSEQVSSYTGCVSGAILLDDYLEIMRDAGFSDVEVVNKDRFGLVTSAKISALRPSKPDIILH
ncbi:MAG: arsenite methyltransferase [Candidatus Thorarchaeota archaeon]|jgi:SAM-dependent methyltransferase